MGELMRAYSWDASPLGPPERWSQSLKTLVGLMLGSSQPMFIIWGPERVWLHNDAMVPLMGAKHPTALGAHALNVVWSEAREALAPLFAKVFAGEPVRMDDITLELDRNGRPEEAHFAFSYTPVREETGVVGGLFGACIETTELIRAERQTQLRFLDALGKEIAKLTEADAILATVTRMLAKHLGVTVSAYADMDEDQDGFTIRGEWVAPGSPSIVGRYKLADFGELAVRI